MTDMPLLTALGERMRWLNARQDVVAQNIAAADLPGYRAKDIAQPDFARAVDRMGSDSFRRMRGEQAQGLEARSTGTVKPNGNDVSVEEELLALADIQMDYAAMTNLYRKQMNLMRLALGKGRG